MHRHVLAAWHTEVSLQIRDERLFFNFPSGKLRVCPSFHPSLRVPVRIN